jgi:hypothetical protein
MEETPIPTKNAGAGTKVKGLRIEVTHEIIATAIPANSGHCMISDAVKMAAVKKKMRVGKVLTDLQTIRFTDLDEKRRYICFTPREGQLALLTFDQGMKPEPFSFRLKPVQIIEKQHRERKATADQPGKGVSKPEIAIQMTGGHGGYSRPVKVGGKALATTSVGLRREFGLRRLGVATT